MAEKGLNKKKRKEPLIDDEPIKRPPSHKKVKNVVVWVYGHSWFSNKDSCLKWRKYHTKYFTREGAVDAIKAEVSTRTSWNNYFSKKTPIPFYWIGDSPPDVS